MPSCYSRRGVSCEDSAGLVSPAPVIFLEGGNSPVDLLFIEGPDIALIAQYPIDFSLGCGHGNGSTINVKVCRELCHVGIERGSLDSSQTGRAQWNWNVGNGKQSTDGSAFWSTGARPGEIYTPVNQDEGPWRFEGSGAIDRRTCATQFDSRLWKLIVVTDSSK